jgi:hypothetical protein
MRVVSVALTLVAALALSSPVVASEQTHTASLQAELEAMLESDQALRQRFADTSKSVDWDSPEVKGLEEEQERLDAKNIGRLLAIFDEHGWPRSSEVGENAALAAFLVLQHADDLAVQQRVAPAFRVAVSTGDAKKSHLALLEDRLLVRTNKPQLYGTQVSYDDRTGKPSFFPIEDEANVDSRRADMGLGPIAEYAKQFQIEYSPPGG